jgi:hypothetical protein
MIRDIKWDVGVMVGYDLTFALHLAYFSLAITQYGGIELTIPH